ncbi:MAG: hypothetical protein PHI68_03625 [Candidatus Cloacimonetes bacterium]|nr:hypothetical protein [Candidatus Cloacimonadota bacterium]
MMMKLKDYIVVLVFLALVISYGIYLYSSHNSPRESSTVELPPIETYVDPVQEQTDIVVPELHIGKSTYTFKPKASYQIAGVLVSKRKYSKGFMSDISPWDFALAWKAVPEYLKHIKFDQIVRFCLFYLKPDAPVSPDYVSRHFSNNHLIPATDNLRRAMKLAREGMKVELGGYLVDVESKEAGKGSLAWKSSLSRTDTGNGACEIIYVTKLRLEDRLYE